MEQGDVQRWRTAAVVNDAEKLLVQVVLQASSKGGGGPSVEGECREAFKCDP